MAATGIGVERGLLQLDVGLQSLSASEEGHGDGITGLVLLQRVLQFAK